MQNESDSGSQPEEHEEAAHYDLSYLRLRKKAAADELGLAVKFQTWEMKNREILLLCDLGVCVEPEDQLRPIASGTKAELLEELRLLLDEAYPDEGENGHD